MPSSCRRSRKRATWLFLASRLLTLYAPLPLRAVVQVPVSRSAQVQGSTAVEVQVQRGRRLAAMGSAQPEQPFADGRCSVANH